MILIYTEPCSTRELEIAYFYGESNVLPRCFKSKKKKAPRYELSEVEYDLWEDVYKYKYTLVR